ncbi:MAG: hypothetical protein OEY52_01560 [Gammaproteobacteria bacterium]|nr:hypothetical protein [Gammaproteobacteria bacterium]
MNEQAHHYRRRRRFVDKMIQGNLLWGLIMIESILFTIGMLVIYIDLQSVLSESMYRIHQEANSGRPVLLKELLMIFPWIITANLLLLLVVDRRWKKVVRGIVLQLQDILYRVKRLDLRIYSIQQNDHDVLQQAKIWLDKERDRHASLHTRLREIPEHIDLNDSEKLHKTRECLKSMSRLLPNT